MITKLESYHHESGQRIDHHLGTLNGEAPKRRFLFRYRDIHGTETELTVDEGADGDFEAVFTYPPHRHRNARDTAIAALETRPPDQWTIEIDGIWQGQNYRITIEATRRPS
ncbi:MAG: hypothetical protein U0441_39020 [Polyangiaceae bacterium]